MPRTVAIFVFFMLPFVASAATLADNFAPGTPYYFDSFDPKLQTWKPGQHLNIEEVFKNYQYFEIVLDQDGKGITVNQYIRGIKTGSEMYLELPDGSLRKK